MAFWSDAFDDLADNLSLAGAVLGDAANNLNPFSDTKLGDAPLTAREAEKQNAEREGRAFSEKRATDSAKGGLELVREASTSTVKDVGTTAGELVDGAGKAAGTALDLLTNPYVLALGAAVVLLVVLAPYAAPVVAKAIK